MAIVSIGLLFLQNFADLMLPTYMSSMVDTGIIRGGISEPAPRAIPGEAYDLLVSYGTDMSAYVKTDKVPGDFPGFDTATDYIFADTAPERLAAIGATYGSAAVHISRNITVDLNDATAEEVINQANPDAATVTTGPLDVPPQTQFEIGVSLTKVFYKALGADMGAIQQKSIFGIGLIMLLITLFAAAITIANGFLSARISTGTGRNLRHDVFAKVQTFAPAEFDKFSTATLITRCTNDVQQIQMVAMMGLRMICSAPIMGIGGIIMAVRTSPSLTPIVIIAVILLTVLQIVIFSKVIPKFKIMQKLRDKLNLVTREGLTGMMVIRAFGNEQQEINRFEQANRNIRDTNRYVQFMMTIQQPTMNFIMSCTTLAVIFFGARIISAGNLQVGQMMAFMQYVMQIIMSFLAIGMMFVMIPQALVSAGRIEEVLKTETKINDKKGTELKSLGKRAKGELVFDNISFSYEDAESPVLENINFTAKAGETTAFIGSTGSGKSTLINLIPRFYDVTKGAIRLDGVDIRELSVHELRSNLGYVPQKGILFSGDIGSNLEFAKEDATDEEKREAIKVAQAEEFVYADKDGMNTEIAQSGDNVSGGQKQRLSIARALVKKPPIYIFDDSFSALDFRTDAKLRGALREYAGETRATVLIVAQRISTIMNAQQIIVLDAGKIVGKGTHRELLESCAEYREIAESQLTKEELA
jgi:ATP-binding cassette subfamily B protein